MAVNDPFSDGAAMLELDSPWKSNWVLDRSSPFWYENPSYTCMSICGEVVYKPELSGLFDLLVTSDLAEDI
jgi:hypothetical protein